MTSLQRRRSDHSPVGRFRQDGHQGVFEAAEAQEPDKGFIHLLPESENFTWDCLVSSEEIFEEIPNQDARHGTPCFAPYLRDAAFESGRESKSHSEFYEPQELYDDGSVSAFAKPRAGKGGERLKVVGRLECGFLQFNPETKPCVTLPLVTVVAACPAIVVGRRVLRRENL